MKVLIVDDDVRLARALAWALRRPGYEVAHVGTARDALRSAPGDLVLVDIDLPDGDGRDVCARLRARGGMGIIALGGQSTERDRVACLRAGADDFVTKPFSVAELLARIEAVLRRAVPQPGGELQVQGLRLDLDRHEATVDGEGLFLNRKEFQLLAMLAQWPGQALSRQRLAHEVWSSSWQPASRTLEVHIARLRAKLGDRVRIETVRGTGYRLCQTADDGRAMSRPALSVAGR